MTSAAFGFRTLHRADDLDRISGPNFWTEFIGAGSVFMAMALAGYLGTMMAALVALMTLWNSIIGPPTLERIRPQPHPVVVIAQGSPEQVFPTAKQPGPWGPPVVHGVDEASNTAEDAHVAAAKDAAAEIAKQQLKQVRYQKRKEQLARQRQDQDQHQDQQFSTALGYDQQPPQDVSSASVFSAFGPRRFTTR
jgi:hypothetical protein